MSLEIIVALAVVVAVALLIILIRTHGNLRSLHTKYAAIIDIDAEVQKRTGERDTIVKDTEKLRTDYRDKRQVFDRLKSEVALYEDKMVFIEQGIYEPHFDFTDPEEFKEQIKSVRAEQKAMVKNKTAVTCNLEWHVGGSKAQGRIMIGRNIRLTLRAFNGECDVAIANVRWNNVVAMEKRIRRAAEQIDKLNKSNEVVIEKAYVNLKIKELRLTHEYRERQRKKKNVVANRPGWSARKRNLSRKRRPPNGKKNVTANYSKRHRRKCKKTPKTPNCKNASRNWNAPLKKQLRRRNGRSQWPNKHVSAMSTSFRTSDRSARKSSRSE